MIRPASLFAAATFAFVALVQGACASDGTKPKDMSAADHRAAAETERTKAAQHREQKAASPEATRTPVGRSGSVPGIDDVIWGDDVYDPSLTHNKTAKMHGALAAQHDAAAKTLEMSEAASCKAFPEKTRGICPLIGTVTKTENIDGGVRVYLNDAQPADAVAAHVQCHLAVAQTQGRKGMDGCPLYLDGVTASRGEGYIDLGATGEEAVRELRRRANAHIGTAE